MHRHTPKKTTTWIHKVLHFFEFIIAIITLVVLVGMLALEAGMCGFTGNKNLLESEEFSHYLDNLGEKHEVMDLYFKPYPCCRWGHPAIDACLAVMGDHNITAEDIEQVIVETFYKATQLSKGIPSCADDPYFPSCYPAVQGNSHNRRRSPV